MYSRLLLFFFFISCLTFGQSKEVDSLTNELDKAESLENKTIIQLKLAKEYYRLRKLEVGNETSHEALYKAIELNNPELIADAYLIIANIHYLNWEGPEAISYYQKIDSVLSKNNIINKTLYESKSNIGNLIHRTYTDSLDLVKIKKYFNEALDIAIALNDSIRQSRMLIRFGDLHQNFTKYDDAIIMYKKAEKLINKDDKESIADLYWALAEVYLNIKDKITARNYMDSRYELVKDSPGINERAGANWVHGNLLFMAEDYHDAIKHHKLSITLYDSLEHKSYGRLAGAAGRIYRSYEKLGDYKSAFNYLKEAMVYNDSALARAKDITIKELETKYQTEKKEQEIKLLTSENALIEKQKKNQRLILLSAITISSLAALFLFFLFKSRRKVNKKLRELDATKSRFFANISHEFRTPLTLISNPIEEAVEDKSLSEEKREQFKVAKRNSDRLLTLVNQLLDLSKIDANQLKLNIEKADLTAFIAALTDSFSYSAQQKEISYEVNIEPNTTEAYFDRDAIEKIITNLIANAIKYAPNKEQIKLSCSIVEQQLLFEIKNSGSQLKQNELNSLFNRFYQTSEEHSGSGIGLALVKELVDLHKGTITVNNTEGNWISFSVKLPVDYKSYKNETFVTSAKDNLSKVETYKHTIHTQEDDISINDDKPILLIVEDHADIRNLVKGLFSDTYRILTATHGEEGIDLAIEHVPDIIISDVMMPIKDGIALTQHLKNDERTSHIPIVLLTAKAGDSNELLGIEVGADDYITKPFNSKILTTKVEKLIENRRLLQERYSQELVLLPKDVAVTNIDEQFLERLKHVLDTNLVEPTFSASRFSEAIGMSRMQLHRKLKAITGLTTSEFIRSQRIKLAAELLKKSDANVSEIGYSVGFNDHSYFTKCFKEIYGCSPTEYISKL